ncbi:hypothetical protein I9D17_07660 [Campylobacter jejuni]|nr:hypothetical protein [Campylobacter jejuni]HAN0533493.1 hypothetical protein [Campylobacter jejuni]HAN0625772.1 hypothetical protein [Campylobacter jejuni]HED6834119.1 hypothetical protein [Campylobacter jejuni]HEH4979836.1 hypothetical protein [Campylobacter jejuni]
MNFKQASNLLNGVKHLFESENFNGKDELIKLSLKKLEGFLANQKSKEIAENVSKCFQNTILGKTYKSALKSHTFKGYKGRQIKERVEL